MEMWDIYDENKQKTGKLMKRNDWNMADDEYHLTVLGIVENLEGKYLITRRSMDKSWAPGHWEIPGGGVMAGEESLEAAIREVTEETGLDVAKAEAELVFTYKQKDPHDKNNYFVDIYKFKMDFDENDVNFQEKEILGFALATKEEIVEYEKRDGFLHYKRIENLL